MWPVTRSGSDMHCLISRQVHTATQAYLGHFLGGANNFILPKFNPFLPKFLPARGGHLFCQAAVPSFSAKLSCQTVLLMDKLEDRWLKNRQKWEKYRKVWQKPTKSGRRQTKMTEKLSKCGVLLIIFCQASHFCPAKLSFLSCKAPIFVLPSFPFCPAKLNNFSRGGRPSWSPPPKYAYG